MCYTQAMKQLLIAIVAIAYIGLAVGLVQDYFNNPTHNCIKRDTRNGYWLYICKDKPDFYIAY